MDLRELTIRGKEYQYEEHVLGQLNTGDRMKVSVRLGVEQQVEVLWPDDLPLPESGDIVMLNYADSMIELVVDDRRYTLDATGASASSILIRAHRQPLGWAN